VETEQPFSQSQSSQPTPSQHQLQNQLSQNSFGNTGLGMYFSQGLFSNRFPPDQSMMFSQQT
jgi:hypothetical protein